ncbi:MAG: bifunctional phosphoserine phosphatase/homoserine phosphotransferase ThrH [Spirochaetia bacterium]
MQHIVCLDLEGVLVPEIWIAFAEKTGISELRLTTRDVPDYSQLMNRRIAILEENNLTLQDIQNVISSMAPLEGGKEFLDTLRSETQVIILSDTFTQFAKPLMRQLDWPTLFCNSLIVDDNTNKITGFQLRQEDGKRKAVLALKALNYNVIASGDSYNDLTMIEEAGKGVLFRPPQSIVNDYQNIPVAQTHSELLHEIRKHLRA